MGWWDQEGWGRVGSKEWAKTHIGDKTRKEVWWMVPIYSTGASHFHSVCFYTNRSVVLDCCTLCTVDPVWHITPSLVCYRLRNQNAQLREPGRWRRRNKWDKAMERRKIWWKRIIITRRDMMGRIRKIGGTYGGRKQETNRWMRENAFVIAWPWNIVDLQMLFEVMKPDFASNFRSLITA